MMDSKIVAVNATYYPIQLGHGGSSRRGRGIFGFLVFFVFFVRVSPALSSNTKRRPAGRLEVKVRLSLYEGRFLSRAEESNRPVLTQFSKSSRNPWAE
jgi:hypothetical protein